MLRISLDKCYWPHSCQRWFARCPFHWTMGRDCCCRWQISLAPWMTTEGKKRQLQLATPCQWGTAFVCVCVYFEIWKKEKKTFRRIMFKTATICLKVESHYQSLAMSAVCLFSCHIQHGPFPDPHLAVHPNPTQSHCCLRWLQVGL